MQIVHARSWLDPENTCATPTKNPLGLRQTGFVCPARHSRAGADLALSGRDSPLPGHPPLEPGVRVSPHPAQASTKSPEMLQGPAFQRQVSSMKLTMAVRV